MNKGLVWLTGGGTGIGKELAILLAKKGWLVIISGRRYKNLIDVTKYNKKLRLPDFSIFYFSSARIKILASVFFYLTRNLKNRVVSIGLFFLQTRCGYFFILYFF